jgi:ABC-type uncharacterized transport system permease subunit
MDLFVHVGSHAPWKCAVMLIPLRSLIIGAVAVILLFLTLPSDFPYQGMNPETLASKQPSKKFSRQSLKRVDFLGTALLLSATILLVTVLEETGWNYAWGSAFSIVLLVVSVVSWALFLGWSYKITKEDGVREAVFPWRFMQNRVCIGLLL